MTESCYFSELTVNLRELPCALRADLVKGLDYALHQWIWRYFTHCNDRQFLFHVEQGTPLKVYILSRARPQPSAEGVERGFYLRTREVSPSVREGQRFSFEMLCSPRFTRNKSKVPLLRDCWLQLRDLESPLRTQACGDAISHWLSRIGEEQGGFRLLNCQLDKWSSINLTRKGHRLSFDSAEVCGVIEITVPLRFITKLLAGFGSEKAFGYGLMLLKGV